MKLHRFVQAQPSSIKTVQKLNKKVSKRLEKKQVKTTFFERFIIILRLIIILESKYKGVKSFEHSFQVIKE